MTFLSSSDSTTLALLQTRQLLGTVPMNTAIMEYAWWNRALTAGEQTALQTNTGVYGHVETRTPGRQSAAATATGTLYLLRITLLGAITVMETVRSP